MRQNDSAEIQKFLADVAREITFDEARDAVILELRGHLQDQIESGIACGLPEPLAVRQALRRMGDPSEIGRSLNSVHRPRFDGVLAALVVGLCLVGLWNLSATKWAAPQLLWMSLGVGIVVAAYRLSLARLQAMLASLYAVAGLGLLASFFSGVSVDGQSYLAVFGLTIKIVDFSGVLFALSLPALSVYFRGTRAEAFAPVTIFLLPLGYFAVNGFLWAGALVLVSGLCSLGTLRLRQSARALIGVAAAALWFALTARSTAELSPTASLMSEKAHTDYAFQSLGTVFPAQVIAFGLFAGLLLHGYREAVRVRGAALRSFALVAMCLLATQIVLSVAANVEILPMVTAGVNVPFLSYGGSGVVANALVVAVLLACLKRRTLDDLAA